MNGIWREGDLLVVDLHTADFRGRCPWTNEEVEEVTLIPVFGPRPAGWKVSVLRGVRHEVKTELLRIALPASQGWLDRRTEAKRRFGYKIAFLGVCALVAGVVLCVILNVRDPDVFQRPHPNAFTVSVMLMVIGAFAAILGLNWPKIEGAPGPGGYLKAELIDEPYIWIHGADPKFLASLPESTGEPLSARKVAGTTFADAIATGWPFLVILTLVGIVIATLLGTAR